MKLHALRPSASPLLLALPLLCVALIVFALAVRAEVPNQSLRQDDLVIYYGVLPAELVALHELDTPGTHMSGRDAQRPGAHHVVVALFDTKTGQRIQEATVTARIVPLSGAPEEKALKPMAINDSMSFGNFFRLDTGMHYVIHLRILRAEMPGKDVEAQFRYQHPTH